MLSIIIPANNEGPLIGECLSAVLASSRPEKAEVIVVANGCSDDTEDRAQAFQVMAALMGWTLKVLSLPEGNKMKALNAGDAAATGQDRVYLDADVRVSPELLGELNDALSQDRPVYASGKLNISPAQSRATQAYRRIYQRVPFIRKGVPGAGVFAVNGPGRARWGEFPNIISDDTFVRLQFMPGERVGVAAGYDWPLVEGFKNLVRVRRRQNAGVREISVKYPALSANDDKEGLGIFEILRLALSDPEGFLVYAGVALIVKLTPQSSAAWGRGR